ncbi:cell wall metabolism sensor histidine kinase WalK [Actinomadura sp. NEAU-AAG7]|uniref:sensor histidine kinase n=1 Tax=Actinomadura sp. NEAU-AAG7 TaxID=2839640 RepID=UPI001BE3F5F9|nr:HAMP domain-containing sensor histidine kinase [Actinomadura sp. NEAU-AAG7]MBT2212055.1 HAMP domain-containing histidine kinase [Actinomadura sp. NEAU-AAG7]
MPRRLGSVRARAALGAALAAAVVFGAGGWWVRDAIEDQWMSAAREAATRDAFSVASALESGAGPRGTDSSFAVVRTDGRCVMTGGTAFDGDLDRPLPGFPPRVGWSVRTVRGKGRFVVGTTDVLPADRIEKLTGGGGQPAQRLTVYVLVSASDTETAVATVDRLLGWGLPLAVPFVGLIAWFVTGRALRPVEAIRVKMADVSARALDQRVPVPDTGDEITRLARTTNETLDRLEHAHHRQQRFVADASHELRTPLAGLRNSLEIALAYPERTDWPGTVATALADADRLQRLAEDLLLLASPARAAATPSDLADIVEEQIAERAHTGDGPTFTARTTRPALVRESETRLARIVRNLLDNAARHARAQVTVTVAATDGSVTLTVADDGPGVPPEERERIFERFVRLDDARTRADGGTGLGLTIVRDLVTGLGGTARMADHSTFVVTLPGHEE